MFSEGNFLNIEELLYLLKHLEMKRNEISFYCTYPPRECGIGTFTNNLFNSMIVKNERREYSHEGFIVALNDTRTYL